MALPGCFLTKWIANGTNPGVSWKLCLLVFSIVTVVASVVLAGPDQWYWVFLFGAIWGICSHLCEILAAWVAVCRAEVHFPYVML